MRREAEQTAGNMERGERNKPGFGGHQRRQGKAEAKGGRQGQGGKSILGDPPGHRRLRNVLRSQHGVGGSRAESLCRKLGVQDRTPWRRRTDKQRESVERLILNLPEGRERVRAVHRERRRRHSEAQTIRVIRRRRGLPVRGQRTKTNARTAKRLNPKRIHQVV